MRLPQATFHTNYKAPRWGKDRFRFADSEFLSLRLGLIMVILVW